jgi:hypothetical protein
MMRTSTIQVSSVCSDRKSWKSEKKKMQKVKEPSDENQSAMKFEPNPLKDRAMPEGDNPSF